MKQLFFSLLLFTFCISLQAKHIIGGTMSYRNFGQTGNNVSYQIKIHLYRDCTLGNPNFDDPLQSVCIYQEGTGILYQNISINMLGSPIVVYASPCMEEAYYITSIILPISELGYIITFERCCRNNTISNLDMPSNDGFRLSVRIPPSNIMNNSVELTNLCPFLGNNANFEHTISGVDLDNDSIVYELSMLQKGGTPDNPIPSCSNFFVSPINILFNSNFSLQNILNSTTPLTINNQGQLNATGIPIGIYAFGLDTKEFRNGQWVSASHSEFSIYILNNYVGLDKDQSLIDFYVSPNPTNTVNLSLSIKDLKNYEIYSSEGNLTLIGKDPNIDISSLTAGIYLIKVETDKGIGRKFFVKW